MARRIAVAWAAEDSEAALHARYRAEAVIEVRTRLHALWLLRRGEPRPRWRPPWAWGCAVCTAGCSGTGKGA